MPNFDNYQDANQTQYPQRPERIAQRDLKLILDGEKSVLFGETSRDVVELWLYDDNGIITGHITLKAGDAELTLNQLVDEVSSNNYVVNIDILSAIKRANVLPGRYTLTTNYFRNEVGSEDSYQMFIATISPSRTELRLQPIRITDRATTDIFEFTEPAVTRQFAQALIDQVFQATQNFIPSEAVTLDKIEAQFDVYDTGSLENTNNKIFRSGLTTKFNQMIANAIPLIRNVALNEIAADIGNIQIQNVEFKKYISDAVTTALSTMLANGQVDSRFRLDPDPRVAIAGGNPLVPIPSVPLVRITS